MTRDQCDVPAPEECPLYSGTAQSAVTTAQVAAGARGAAQPPQPSAGARTLQLASAHTQPRITVDSLVLRLQSCVEASVSCVETASLVLKLLILC